MEIRRCNIWELMHEFDAICVTTNGIVKSDGKAVMGKGIALQARNLFPGIDVALAGHLKLWGNIPAIIWHDAMCKIVSFPTKNDWKDKSSLELIDQSAFLLSHMIEGYGWTKVAMTKPGCGNGGLNWADVEPIIVKHLPDMVICESI